MPPASLLSRTRRNAPNENNCDGGSADLRSHGRCAASIRRSASRSGGSMGLQGSRRSRRLTSCDDRGAVGRPVVSFAAVAGHACSYIERRTRGSMEHAHSSVCINTHNRRARRIRSSTADRSANRHRLSSEWAYSVSSDPRLLRHRGSGASARQRRSGQPVTSSRRQPV
jgi:hypothetical protein